MNTTESSKPVRTSLIAICTLALFSLPLHGKTPADDTATETPATATGNSAQPKLSVKKRAPDEASDEYYEHQNQVEPDPPTKPESQSGDKAKSETGDGNAAKPDANKTGTTQTNPTPDDKKTPDAKTAEQAKTDADKDKAGALAQNTTVAREINKLGFSLLKNSQEGNSGNFLFSPVSVYTSLAILRYGANPNDKQFLSRLTDFPSDQRLNLETYIIHRLLASDIASPYKQHINYSLWIDKNADYIKQSYQSVKKYFPVVVHSADFGRQPYDSIAKINKYITQDTTVNRCVYSEDVDKRTALVLTGVMGINGNYAQPFKLIRSSRRSGKQDKSGSWYKKVNAIEFRGKLDYFENNKFKAVKLPFKNKKLSITFIVPKSKTSNLNALHSIENSLDETLFNSIHDKGKKKQVTVLLPKFRYESLFDETDLFRLLGHHKTVSSNKYLLKNTTFKHKAMFGLFDDVHWNPSVKRNMPNLKSPGLVNFNRPFLYILRHESSKLVLMIGRVTDPKEWINANEYHSLIGSWRTAYDLDGDGYKDKIGYVYTGGANCCYRLKVTLTSIEKTITLPFEIEGGYPTGLNLSNPRRFNVIKSSNGPPKLYMEIQTSGDSIMSVPAKWSKKYGFKTNWILVSFVKGKLKVEDFVK